MSRPVRRELRTAILDGLDKKPISTVKDVISHLKETNQYQSDQSTRRMLIKMCREGLVYELPKRGDKGTIFYTKHMFNKHLRLITANGENVTLRGFIHELLENTSPDILSDSAMKAIKVWMLDSLGSTIPVAYSSKSREVPDEFVLKGKLEETAAMLSYWHKFVTNFLNADIWSEFAREKLAEDFNSNCVEEHAIIVDRSWMENADDAN